MRKNSNFFDKMSNIQVDSLTDVSSDRVLEKWNETQKIDTKELCIHQMFEAQVTSTPDAIAVVFENTQLTYQQLNQRANQLAHYLRSLGVGSEVLVGICMERSLEMVVGILGILKAGGAYVPLDPAYPLERLSFILEDTQTPVMLTQRSVKNLPVNQTQVVYLDSDWQMIAQNSQENPVCTTTADNLIYVIYTSGSTGKPKGVMIPHRGICNEIYWRQTTFELTQRDKVLQTISFSFDPSVWQIFWPLCFGAQLIMVRPGGHQDSAYLVKMIASEQITIIALVPAMLRVLLEDSGIENCKCLRHITTGGEAIPVELIERFFDRLNLENVLINCYGPTEASIDTTFWTCKRGTDHLIAPIGRPIANAQTYILDENLQPVPMGELGELHIGGVCLARGYLNLPELTAEKFIPNPYSSEPEARLYKTGDLARYMSDGQIEFLGRIDHQVKVRGFRIELGEIEAILVKHPAVQQTLVMATEDVNSDKRLVAYVVAKPEQVKSQSELRRFLLDKLPDYMVPAAFVFLDALPLSPNGKIDRRALPAPDTSSFSRSNSFVAPRTPTEFVLTAIWEQVLGLEAIGIYDNFFELGGHSLLATQVISQCRQAFCVEIPLHLVFEKPTIASLAGAIAQNQTNDALEHQTIPQQANRESAPLSFAQQRVWFLEQMEPNSSTYLISKALRLRGKLNVDVLQQSLDAIVNHHEALRTNFISLDGSPIQVIGLPRSVELMVIDLTQEQEREDQVQRLLNQEAQRPFNLTSDLMLRATLLQINQQEYILLLVMHHIASDGWSMGILWQQLAAVYEAFLSEKPNPLSKLPIQYADFAHWQRQWLSGEVLETQMAYWKNQLAGANHVLELPTDRPRPPVQTYQGATQSLMLPQTLAASLTARSRQEGVTLFMTLLAAFATLLHRYTGQEDVSIGSPIAGRNRAEIEGLIGFFINTVVLRTDFSGNPSFRSLLNRVRTIALGAYAHQDMPFEKLVEELHPERDTSRNPLFQVWFNMLNLGDIQLELPEMSVEPIAMLEAASKFDLTLYVTEQKQGIQLELLYNADLFAPERMMEMLAQFNHLLIQIVENPAINIAALSLVTPKAKLILPNPQQQLPNQWEKAVHTSFSQQAQRVPEQLAVVDAQAAWTYAELEERANQLANYLLANNIQSQDIVAIYGHRSATLVWAILGVLKAGAAFVILDPAYPANRLIDCLDIVQPSAWLQIASEAELPTALQEYVDLSCSCRLQLKDLLQDYATNDPEVAVEPDHLAYVAFTSGSTGKPKGIKGTHRPLSHFLQWHRETFGLNQSDRFSMLSGLSHDPLLRDIFTPLSLGATLCIPDQKDIETPGKLADWMRLQQVSIAHLTPAMAQLLTANTNNQTTNLRYLFFGGDVLTQDLHGIRDFAPLATCVNFYGATETPQAMGYFIIPNHSDRSSFKQTIPLGRGIEDVQLLVLTNGLQLAGIGEVGEIYVRTPYLAQGYIGSDQLTQERFIINPFTKISTDRLYKTGDLGRYLPDGNIKLLGRIDHQVKIRGFRIELGEIEAILSQHPAVQETVVYCRGEQRNADARSDVPSEKQLVAYVVPKQEQVTTTSELRRFLEEKLPNYMIPRAFVMLDALPLTPNGKVDRLALPVFDQVRQEAEKTFVAPRNQLEQKLTLIWEQILGVQNISVRDNFFDLGGHSLLAVRLFAEIENEFGTKIPLATLFKSGTVEALAKIISQKEDLAVDHQVLISDKALANASWSSLVEIQPNGSKPPLFCIHAIGGEILCYRDLALHLGSEQPVYGLQPQGLDGKQPPLTRVEDMAERYIQEIQILQPNGPYFLAGYSFGGIVAFEMAQQLLRQGQKVGFLVMLDTCRPGSSKRSPFLKRVFLHLDNVLQLGPAYLWQKAADWSEWGKYHLKHRYKHYRDVVEHLLDTDKHLDVIKANAQAFSEYTFQVYPGRMTLLRTEDQNRSKAEGVQYDPQFGWSDLIAGGLDVHYVSGSHDSLLYEPHVRVLAEKLKVCLADTTLSE